MRSFKDLTGKLFGSLKVIAYTGVDRHGCRRWRVLCAICGYQNVVLAANLVSGRTKNCGCLQREIARHRMKALHRAADVVGAEAMEGY